MVWDNKKQFKRKVTLQKNGIVKVDVIVDDLKATGKGLSVGEATAVALNKIKTKLRSKIYGK